MSFRVKVKVDTTAVERQATRVINGLGNLGPALLTVLREAAATERETHRYRNQTGFLQSSTQAWMTQNTPGNVEAVLAMQADYASIIADKGLSNIMEVAQAAEDILTASFEDIE
ncbi:MAG: hypothetical protein Q8S13_09110 [Dehalococcoidia bacterium]|nr:hypothetical protein [Dehalococcoidia bacterium]